LKPLRDLQRQSGGQAAAEERDECEQTEGGFTDATF
jgi:hypothetical protein